MKTAVIVGSGGQDGSLLFEKLDSLGYILIGIEKSGIRPKGIDWAGSVSLECEEQIEQLVKELRPDEIYYLAAFHQSAEDTFESPAALYTASESINIRGALFFLEAIRKFSLGTKFFYAASSHVFGTPDTRVQDELTPIRPNSIYGITKAAALQLVGFYRNTYHIFASAGILYNHESPLRPEKFISKKIVRSAVRIKLGLQDKISVGSISAEADWGYAPDYVEAMIRILKTDSPDDYVVATGKSHKVRDFLEISFAKVGLDWTLYVEERAGIISKSHTVLIGNSTKLRNKTGWKPSLDFEAMVGLLVDAELKSFQT